MIKQNHELLPWPNGTDLHQQETSAWHRLSAPPLSCYWSLGALLHHSRAVTLTSSTRPLLILWQQPKPRLAIISSNCSTEALKCQLQSRDRKQRFPNSLLTVYSGCGHASLSCRGSSSSAGLFLLPLSLLLHWYTQRLNKCAENNPSLLHVQKTTDF